ncbi:MAG: hypothetical protein ABIF10_04385, partial [Candidatus Woesearchaeota archaeon]
MKKLYDQMMTGRLIGYWCVYADQLQPITDELRTRPYTERYQYLNIAAAGNPAVGKTYRGTLLAPNTSLPDYFAGIEITEKSSLKRLFGLWLS